ncbi:MAG: hypothetical protein SH850_07435 [Planctomycetaceae bacterium]|nr:hypothetical protein [Planctomycetaceae bacterium]
MSHSTTRDRLRAIAVFRKACGNELAVDEACMRMLGLEALLPAVIIPRPIQLTRKLSRFRRLWPPVFRLASVLWCFGLFPLLLMVQAFRTLRQWRSCPRTSTAVTGDAVIVLGQGPRIHDIVQCIPEERRPRCWITVPWWPVLVPESSGESLPLLSVAGWGDFVQTWCLAWRSVLVIRQKGLRPMSLAGCRTAVLQTFVAWEWFLVWRLLPRCVAEGRGLWFVNHYDRMAVLLDRLPVNGPRHLVQHGFSRSGVQLACQLRHVSEVLYFDQQTRQILQEVALAKTCRPQWTPIKTYLTLTPWTSTNAVGRSHPPSATSGLVLVIGQPVEPELERELLTALAAALPGVVLLYKAHPLYGRSGAAHVPSPPVEILWEPSLFPAVDVVLSGWSWLGVEYESTGTPVVWYKSLPLGEVVARVQTELRQAAKRAHAA